VTTRRISGGLLAVMAPSYVLTNARGMVSTRDEEIAEVRNHHIHYHELTLSDLKVQL
jgi:hypothetical protein